MRFFRYSAVVVGLAAFVLGTIVTANTVIALSPFIYGSPAMRAAVWQREAGGIVAIAPGDETEFKTLVLAERAPTLQTLVVGSSRVMALRAKVTGPNSYNLGISSNILASAISQADEAATKWARESNIALIDAAASEDYGCVATDFIDAHHATESCWEKIFHRRE